MIKDVIVDHSDSEGYPYHAPVWQKVVGDTLVCNETSFDSIRQDQFNNLVLLMLTNTISSLKMQLGGGV